jgi:hypothetical protein
MLNWFDARDAQQFGTTLADFFIEKMPAATLDKSEKATQKKREVLQKITAQAEVFKISHKLNLYKKAKLGNAFKWKLLDGGYPEDVVDELTRALLVRI